MTKWTRRVLPACMLAVGLLGSSAALAAPLIAGPHRGGGSVSISEDVPKGVNIDQGLRGVSQEKLARLVVRARARQNPVTLTGTKEGVGGFGWNDAGIGAAVGAATTLLIGVMFAASKRRLNPLHS